MSINNNSNNINNNNYIIWTRKYMIKKQKFILFNVNFLKYKLIKIKKKNFTFQILFKYKWVHSLNTQKNRYNTLTHK